MYIECKNANNQISKGTGVIVNSRGLILTARHVVPAGYSCTGERGTAARTPSRRLILRRASSTYDAMLLQFVPDPKETFEPLQYVPLDDSLAGAKLTAYGFVDDPGQLSQRSGTVSTTIPNQDGFIQTDVLTARQMSGGPVVTNDGGLVGIVAGAQFDSSGLPTYYAVFAAELVASEFSLKPFAGETVPLDPVKADILIGVAGPITGPNAAFGAQFQKGAEQAAADINAAGGINGQQIKLEIGDDVSDPKRGISVANKFVAAGVKYVVGHFNSSVTIPASKVYAENGVLVITPSGSNPRLTERGLWNTFRTCGRDDQQGKVAGDYLAAHFRDAKIAVVHDKTSYGQDVTNETKAALNANGVTEAMYEGINLGDKDFSALITKMKDAGVSVVYYGGQATEAGLIMRQLADEGLKAQFMSGDGSVSNELASIAGDAIDGMLMTYQPDLRKNPNAKELVKKFRAAGFEPEGYTLYSYAAMQIVAAAATKVGASDDAQKVAEAIKASGPWKTAIGEIGYDVKGDVTRPGYVIYKWRKDGAGSYSFVEEE